MTSSSRNRNNRQANQADSSLPLSPTNRSRASFEREPILTRGRASSNPDPLRSSPYGNSAFLQYSLDSDYVPESEDDQDPAPHVVSQQSDPIPPVPRVSFREDLNTVDVENEPPSNLASPTRSRRRRAGGAARNSPGFEMRRAVRNFQNTSRGTRPLLPSSPGISGSDTDVSDDNAAPNLALPLDEESVPDLVGSSGDEAPRRAPVRSSAPAVRRPPSTSTEEEEPVTVRVHSRRATDTSSSSAPTDAPAHASAPQRPPSTSTEEEEPVTIRVSARSCVGTARTFSETVSDPDHERPPQRARSNSRFAPLAPVNLSDDLIVHLPQQPDTSAAMTAAVGRARATAQLLGSASAGSQQLAPVAPQSSTPHAAPDLQPRAAATVGRAAPTRDTQPPTSSPVSAESAARAPSPGPVNNLSGRSQVAHPAPAAPARGTRPQSTRPSDAVRATAAAAERPRVSRPDPRVEQHRHFHVVAQRVFNGATPPPPADAAFDSSLVPASIPPHLSPTSLQLFLAATNAAYGLSPIPAPGGRYVTTPDVFQALSTLISNADLLAHTIRLTLVMYGRANMLRVVSHPRLSTLSGCGVET